MRLTKLVIQNYKCFKNRFILELKDGLNIIVGDNEAGKSTILEAINLVLTGSIGGKPIKGEISQYLFNVESLRSYFENVAAGKGADLPSILIEAYMEGDELSFFEGDGNSHRQAACGLLLEIKFDEKFREEYSALLRQKNIKTLPVEYYDFSWRSFSRDGVTSRSIPLKCAFIDSSSTRYINGSDIYISRIVKELLTTEEIVGVAQAHRNMAQGFMADQAVSKINERISKAANITKKDVKLSAELFSKHAWENSLTTYLDEVPFHHVGKGEQCIVKTNLALSHNKTKQASAILIEEPENHLSHAKLNELVSAIDANSSGKQVIMTTHSSFVANKLGLENLILLNERVTLRLSSLQKGTQEFFKKIAGYDTLRLILCKKAILVEGDSDELIVQKAYLKKYGKLPIMDGVDVISVGTSFVRFLEIAKPLKKPTSVVTDNDGDVEALNRKYADYLGQEQEGIQICFDPVIDKGDLMIGESKFNYNTLEPKLLKANSLKLFNEILGTKCADENDLHKHMKAKKTDCALALFETDKEINFPEYVEKSIA